VARAERENICSAVQVLLTLNLGIVELNDIKYVSEDGDQTLMVFPTPLVAADVVKVVPDAIGVTVPAPNCISCAENPEPNPAGIVTLTLDPDVNIIVHPLFAALRE
jgi:hypothetical protein